MEGIMHEWYIALSLFIFILLNAGNGINYAQISGFSWNPGAHIDKIPDENCGKKYSDRA